MIYSYQKYIDSLRTVDIALPIDETNRQHIGKELATVNGTTYVFLPDATELPEQPPEITVEPVTLTPELSEAIKTASSHVWLINEQIKEMIRNKYSSEDEMYFARISIGAITGQYTMEPGEADKIATYGAFVESVRQWGRDQRAAIGL
jgi:hypothetical protein